MSKPTDVAQELLRLVAEDHDDAGPICELGETLAHAVLAQAEAKPTVRLRGTYTYAVLEVSPAAYAEVQGLLKAAGYDHAFHEDGGREVIDMHGIALGEAGS